jgi:sodium/hydrogen antiporter
VFGLLSFVDMSGHDADVVLTVMVVTVVGSIIVHGLSTGLVGSWYGRTKAPPGVTLE